MKVRKSIVPCQEEKTEEKTGLSDDEEPGRAPGTIGVAHKPNLAEQMDGLPKNSSTHGGAK